MKNQYNPKEFEKKIYSFWEENNCFQPNNKKNVKNFCIMMPPPNITGNLHMGHAFQQTLMDILIRYNRMQGKNTLWQVGTDHAGIAAQIIFQKKIMSENKKKPKDYGREAFVKMMWKWSKKVRKKITYQIKRLGCSVDWTKERFTLDPIISKAVQFAFITLYNNDYIYKKKRLVNWDTKLKTVISDLEVEHREIKKRLWFIKYKILLQSNNKKTKKEYITVATTRPETLFGDVAIAINPLDKKNEHFIGKKAIIPIVNRLIPIITDSTIEKEKGTGCIKVTPGHSFQDYKIAKKNKLPIINIFSSKGTILKKLKIYNFYKKSFDFKSVEIPICFHNLNIIEARKKVLLKIKNLGLLKKVTLIESTEPYSDRSGSIIEPMLKSQWYLKTHLLAKLAIKATKQKKIQFIPKQYENMYFSWMFNIKDWCISRQLWWGHRIPIWYDKKKSVYIGENEESVRKKYSISNKVKLIQETDVLDTWFSSALWTFATLGWPKTFHELKKFHSTDIIVSGFDIIFFWISRMIMLTLYFIKDKHGNPQVPFKKVLITGLIRDEKGLKMSKSKGNVIDPIDMIDGIDLSQLIKKRTSSLIKSSYFEKIYQSTKNQFPKGIQAFGTDALRFTFASIASNTRYINWDMNRLTGYKNFCNKIWNASKLLLINVYLNIPFSNKSTNCIKLLMNKWILLKLNSLIKSYRNYLDQYRFDEAAKILYDFIWNSFCDWYLEFFKIIVKNDCYSEEKKLETKLVSVQVFKKILLLAHPIIPFITEKIWKKFTCNKENKYSSIMLKKFPTFNPIITNFIVHKKIKTLKNLVSSIRKFKLKIKQNPKKKIFIFIKSKNKIEKDIIKKHQLYFQLLLNLYEIKIIQDNDNTINYKTVNINNIEILYLENNSVKSRNDFYYSEQRVNKLLLKIEKSKKKLSNKNFIRKAPKNVVLKEKLFLIQLKNEKKLYMKEKS